MKTTTSLALLAASLMTALCCAPTVQAVTFDWATVGNPGNAGDTTTYGAVAEIYRISKYEVTNNQYTEFLNAVADTDTNGLYSSSMGSNSSGGITQSGVSGSFSYAVKTGRGENPVNWVTFFDAMRFTNWLENGQPTEVLQALGTTEDGVYTIGTGTNEVRNANAAYFIPSEDEWYKAAYHDASAGIAGTYFDYATGNTLPVSDHPNDDPAAANYRNDDGLPNGFNDGYAVTGSPTLDDAQNYLTDVGAYTQSLSPYGTYDQGGNVSEWNEAVVIFPASETRGARGGAWGTFPVGLDSSNRGNAGPTIDASNIGFRVASIIPEPSTATLLSVAIASMGVLMRRRS